MNLHHIELSEEDRQLVIMGLARLSLEYPGWAQALNEIALKMDNRLPDGSAEMFQELRAIRGDVMIRL